MRKSIRPYGFHCKLILVHILVGPLEHILYGVIHFGIEMGDAHCGGYRIVPAEAG